MKTKEYQRCKKEDCGKSCNKDKLHKFGDELICTACYQKEMNKQNHWCKAIKEAQQIDLIH